MTIQVNANMLRLAHMAISKEETRYYLNGVHVEAHPVKGALLVATDGHRMVVIHDADGQCDEHVIVKLPGYALAQCKLPRSLLSEKRVAKIDVAAKSATISHQQPPKRDAAPPAKPLVTVHDVLIEGVFPDWRKVAPKAATLPIGLMAFNPAYVMSLAKFGEELGADKTRAMYFLREKEEHVGPIVVRWSGLDNVFAVLMSMRAEPVSSLPAFMSEEPQPAIAA